MDFRYCQQVGSRCSFSEMDAGGWRKIDEWYVNGWGQLSCMMYPCVKSPLRRDMDGVDIVQCWSHQVSRVNLNLNLNFNLRPVKDKWDNNT